MKTIGLWRPPAQAIPPRCPSRWPARSFALPIASTHLRFAGSVQMRSLPRSVAKYCRSADLRIHCGKSRYLVNAAIALNRSRLAREQSPHRVVRTTAKRRRPVPSLCRRVATDSHQPPIKIDLSSRNGMTPTWIMPSSSAHCRSFPPETTILRKKSPVSFSGRSSCFLFASVGISNALCT